MDNKNKKKSFFGKLFGKKEKNEEKIMVKTQIKDEEEKKKEKKEAQKVTISVPLQTSEKTEKPKEKEEKEQLISEYEGQLAIDVFQTDEEIIIKSTIAGVKPEDIDVSIDNDMVTIKGERKQDEKIIKENYFYQECYWGAFSRSVILPCDIETDKVSAELKNGILTVHLPKVNKSRTKKISVKAVQ